MVSIKQFFSAHAKLYSKKFADAEKSDAEHVEAKRYYHVDVEEPGSIEAPVIAPEMDALNLWSPWAAKTKAAKGMAPLTEREQENIKNKSWTV